MNLRAFSFVIASVSICLACSLNKKKTTTSDTEARPALVDTPLEGTVFLLDDPFTVVSGYAFAPKVGGGTIKLFDRRIRPCRKKDALGNGRMIQINIPEKAVSFYFRSKQDSEDVEGSVIFEDADRSRKATNAEFERREWSEESVTAALYAGDGDGSKVNGTFTVPRCAETSLENSSDTETKASVDSDQDTDSQSQTQ